MKVLSVAMIPVIVGGIFGIAAGTTTTASAASTATTCPTAQVPGSNAPEQVLTTVRRAVPRLYPGADHQGYRITLMAALAPNSALSPGSQLQTLRQIAVHQCGTTVTNRSWLVLVSFPRLKASASLSVAQLFVARFVLGHQRSGWGIWFRYH